MRRVCVICGESFELMPDKPGLSTHCPRCSPSYEEPKFRAKVSWEGKQTPIVEVTTDVAGADAFNKAQKRFGCSPLRTMCVNPQPFGGGGGGGADRKDGAGPGAEYTSPLGEKHTTKR